MSSFSSPDGPCFVSDYDLCGLMKVMSYACNYFCFQICNPLCRHPFSIFEDCDEETLKRLRHRGRANRCNTCLADDAKTVIMEKVRMEAHIYREHVAPAKVQIRYTLCQ